MPVLLQLSDFTVPGAGYSYPLGTERTFWASLASDTVIGNPTGPAATLLVNGHGAPDSMTVPYGSQLTRRFRGNLIRITPPGAIVELYVADEKIDVASVAVQSPTISGSVAVTGSVGVTGIQSVNWPNGTTAPADGEITVRVLGTGSIPRLTFGSGGTPENLQDVALTAGQLATYTFPARNGVTYTLDQCTFQEGQHKNLGTS